VKIYFKHSTRCPISSIAKFEVDGFLKNNESSGEFTFDYEFIDVIANRQRSNELAEQLGIEHESPQLIITGDGGEVVWNGSHRAITEDRIKEALRG
jgi:bacillithiol system protein YtxJ